MASQSYYEEEMQKGTLHLRELLQELPSFLDSFFRSITQTTSVKTRIGYAYDLRIFFNYILTNHKDFKGKTIYEIDVSDLNKIDSEDIDKFLDYVTLYMRSELNKDSIPMEFTNKENAKSRKLASIRSMYKYFFKKKKIISNPASIVDMPKLHEKQIVRLDVNELAILLDEVENGESLTERQKVFHEKNKCRDLAIVTTLAGTGMRVSECVGININDIDFQNNAVKITRKGGNQVVLYFGEEVKDSLLDYIDLRRSHPPLNEGDDALFLSSKGTRITVRQVQNLVKKYSQASIRLKKISPHKLRSTYGTNLYQETGDIYLVAEVLGHADVNTTKKHYAQIEEGRRRMAGKLIKLRKD